MGGAPSSSYSAPRSIRSSPGGSGPGSSGGGRSRGGGRGGRSGG